MVDSVETNQDLLKEVASQLCLADKMTTVGQLAAGIAHEISNPVGFVLPNLRSLKRQLDSLLGLVDLYQREASSQEISSFRQETGVNGLLAEIPRIISDCIQGAERIQNITRELRQFTRVAKGSRERIVLNDLLESSLLLAHYEIKYRARVLRHYQDIPAIYVDRSKMGQVFLNIIVNAAHAIEEGHIDDNWIRVSTGRKADQVFVEIANSGASIPTDILPRIFDPFFTTQAHDRGTGLGLSISQHIVHQHGGRIEVESDPEKGTTFRIWLVLEPQPANLAQAGPGTPQASQARGRIMVIDDEAAIRTSLNRLLSTRHEVHCATNGKQALDLLQRDASFDVILCDLMMSDISGVDLFEQASEAHPHLARRFVFMTGGAFTPKAEAFFTRTDIHKFEKPIEPDDLLRLIQDILTDR